MIAYLSTESYLCVTPSDDRIQYSSNDLLGKMFIVMVIY